MSTLTPRRHLAIRVPPGTLDRIDRLAENHGLTRTDYMLRCATGDLADPTDIRADLDATNARLDRLEQALYGN